MAMPTTELEIEGTDEAVEKLDRIREAAEEATEAIRKLNSAIERVGGIEYVVRSDEVDLPESNGGDWEVSDDA